MLWLIMKLRILTIARIGYAYAQCYHMPLDSRETFKWQKQLCFFHLEWLLLANAKAMQSWSMLKQQFSHMNAGQSLYVHVDMREKSERHGKKEQVRKKKEREMTVFT